MIISIIKEYNRQLGINEHNVKVISLIGAKKEYFSMNNLCIGTYTLNPYDSNRLVRLENFHKSLAVEKDDELIELLGKMGAMRVKIIENNKKEKNIKVNASGDIKSVKGNTDLSIENKISEDKNLIVEFEGNTVNDIDPELLEKSIRFSNDGQLRAIFNSVRFQPNRLKKYVLKNTYTESFDFDFELAAKYLAVDINLKAEYETIKSKERTFEVEFA